MDLSPTPRLAEPKAQVLDPDEARRRIMERMLRGDLAKTAAPAPIQPRDPLRPVPLTAEQTQLWLHAEMAPDMPLYNESITIHRLGPYSHAALEWAISEVVRRHAIWRTAFIHDGGELVQRVAEPALIRLPIIDISHLPEAERDAEAVRLATEDARAPIPLDQAPLFRARVVKLAGEEHRLYLTLHHIIFDGVSIYRTLVPELASLVAAHERGRPSPLPEPALQYADYAVWQADRQDPASLERQLAHWRTALAQPLPRLELAGDRPRPLAPTHAGSMECFDLPDALVERLKDLARAEGVTLYMVLLAAYKAMLHRYTGDEDVIVGGVTDTRRRPELQPLMGYFLNTMALRSHPRGELPFRAYLAEVKASVIGALGASDYPFDRLIRALNIPRGTGTHPLFNTLFSIEPPVDPFPPGWDLTQMDVTVGAAKYDLYLELDERQPAHGGGMLGRFLYSTELFEPATIRRMIGHWRTLLEAVASDAGQSLASLPMLGADERETLLYTWNNTERQWPHASVVDWLAETVARQPDALAIRQVDGDEPLAWTYAELSARADAVAARLAAEGVRAGDLVGLCLPRSPWMVAAMLAVLRVGAAYLPLDPGFPPARLAMIVEDGAPALVLVEPETAGVLPEGAARQLELARDWPAAPAPVARAGAESLAYVLFTSGSTGRPKGVEIPQGALVNLLASMAERPGFAAGESLLAITTLSFDIAGLELWLPLVMGGTVLLAGRETALDMRALGRVVAGERPTVLQATPATWRGLIESGWQGQPGLRALCGGEALSMALAEQLAARVGELWNVYGPTETTIWSTIAPVDPQAGPISIGRPIANTTVRVLDATGNDRPIGAIGELAIGGAGLARDYRGRPDLTAEKFVTVGEERLYRTGDLARWRKDGTLVCLGRTDHEVKIRGFRIAIEEVEAALARLPGVAGGAARAWADASGDQALAGYVVPAEGAELEATKLRVDLAEHLPDYMIPTRLVVMDHLPLTPNGKVDRQALPEPGAALATAAAGAEPPRGETEQRLAEIWRQVLKVETVSRHDDFFELGGHSLLVVRLLRAIEGEFAAQIPLAALFRARRLSDMAELVGSGEAVENPTLSLLQPRGSQPPLLWLDGGMTVMPLARRLGEDQPFLGVSIDVTLQQAGGCPDKFEQAARLVAEEIVRIQPEGPYRLGGWCTSGIMAFAVAVELRRMGLAVDLLVLAHAFHPPTARATGSMRRFLSRFRYHGGELLNQPQGQRWRYLLERLRGIGAEAGLAGGREAVLNPELRDKLDRIGFDYVPARLDADVLLIQPEDHPDIFDFQAEWAREVTGLFIARTVRGGHRSMLEPPFVEETASVVRAALDERRSTRPARGRWVA